MKFWKIKRNKIKKQKSMSMRHLLNTVQKSNSLYSYCIVSHMQCRIVFPSLPGLASWRAVAVYSFWTTVCKTVRPVLSDRCPVCPVCLSVTLVYCGQTVEWIKMKLGTEVGLGRSHIVLDGTQLPPPQKRGTAAPNFRSMSVVVKQLDGSRWHLVWR